MILENWENMIPINTFSPWFILVQDSKIFDVSSSPGSLMWCLVDIQKNFMVLVGTLNEFDNYEIIGPCAEYWHGPGPVWYLTSPMDGPARLVGITGEPTECISNRLSTLFKRGRLSDPLNFDKVILSKGGLA